MLIGSLKTMVYSMRFRSLVAAGADEDLFKLIDREFTEEESKLLFNVESSGLDLLQPNMKTKLINRAFIEFVQVMKLFK